MNVILEIFAVLICLGLLGVVVFVQFLLCKLKSGLPGMIMPMILFILGFLTSFVSVGSMVIFPLTVFVIPAIVLITIYIVMRRNRKSPLSGELRQMRAQDL